MSRASLGASAAHMAFFRPAAEAPSASFIWVLWVRNIKAEMLGFLAGPFQW